MTVGNGLDALQLALLTAGIGPGDEVLVAAHTFIATWFAPSNVGALPVPIGLEGLYEALIKKPSPLSRKNLASSESDVPCSPQGMFS